MTTEEYEPKELKKGIVHHVFDLTQKDILRWEYDHNFGYVGIANTVEFRVVCNRATNQIGVNGIWFTVSYEIVNELCNEIAKQSERIRTKKIFSQMQQAGICDIEEKGGAA